MPYFADTAEGTIFDPAGQLPTPDEQLQVAADVLRNPDPSLSPMATAKQRNLALTDGLVALAAKYGKQIYTTGINGNGEMPFTIAGLVPPYCGTYGDELAGWLNRIPVRTGINPIQGCVQPYNGWCYINHFDAARLILLVAAENH